MRLWSGAPIIDVTLVDEDTNSIPTDADNRAILGKWLVLGYGSNAISLLRYA